MRLSALGGLCTLALLGTGSFGSASEVGQGGVFSVIEIPFQGPAQSALDSPARDIELKATFRHVSSAEVTVLGFHFSGNRFVIRFCPTLIGRWDLASVQSNIPELHGQHVGGFVTATESSHHGFWVVDQESNGRRWYRRSDGTHPYVFGNTHYTFLTEMTNQGESASNIANDVIANSRYFKKLRFALTGDRYPHPKEKPFLDNEGRPTDDGDNSHRPNPKWFSDRVDVAVRTAFDQDLIADLILAGPDTERSRATLRSNANRGDATPYLRYIAARYGSYPNVWICLCNEYDIKKPKWESASIASIGMKMRGYLPYPTPLSVHASQHPLHGPKTQSEPAWSPDFDKLPIWNDHQILQRKLLVLSDSADVISATWDHRRDADRWGPTINDELSYQGLGDKHAEADTIEAHLGAFLGGGYASTGEKHGNKLGQYFWGNFNPDTHSAARSLGWLRQQIDQYIAFWNMEPDRSIFPGLNENFRAMAWKENEYVLGTNRQGESVAMLPRGEWTITQSDVIARQRSILSKTASGKFVFRTPDSRAVLFHFQKNH
ncbi:MAG: DUF5060 domain-containing protein [Pirellula sp.]